ncbi:MAG: clan AA aspartic protease [Planctomycetota bacterium]|nr:clan AA aspartic protease [Planctomycetota bacterium]MDA1212228.1 clan AA aspartic protease [Planctomycetota bacterium]
MNGHVDEGGRSLVKISLSPSDVAAPHEIQAWIDTGFTGDLVLPETLVEELALPSSGTVHAILADGSQVVLTTHTCLIDWFGERRHLEILANDGEYPLLGVGLLLGHDLHISYRSGEISID